MRAIVAAYRAIAKSGRAIVVVDRLIIRSWSWIVVMVGDRDSGIVDRSFLGSCCTGTASAAQALSLCLCHTGIVLHAKTHILLHFYHAGADSATHALCFWQSGTDSAAQALRFWYSGTAFLSPRCSFSAFLPQQRCFCCTRPCTCTVLL